MPVNNSSNNSYTNNADGFSLAGGTTPRTLSLTAGNVSLSAGGSNTYTLPAATGTLVSRDSTDTLTNKDVSSSTNTYPNGFVLQVVGTNFAAVATGTTIIPGDDTIPQITEGTEFMTQAITPKYSTSTLIVEVMAMVSYNTGSAVIGAIFQDSTANAVSVGDVRNTANGEFNMLVFKAIVTAGTTSSTTFRFRAGGDNAGTVTFNGNGGTRAFGTAPKSTMTITEVKA